MAINRRRSLTLAFLAAAAWGAAVLTACGGGQGTAATGQQTQRQPRPLSEEEVQAVLHSLPYHYFFRRIHVPAGASGAVAGQVHGPRHTDLAFSITLGSQAEPVPVPESGVGNVIGVPVAGFMINANTLVKIGSQRFAPSKEVSGPGQFKVAEEMVFRIEEKLCRISLGGPCPV